MGGTSIHVCSEGDRETKRLRKTTYDIPQRAPKSVTCVTKGLWITLVVVPQVPEDGKTSLKTRAMRRLAVELLFIGGLLFASAGSWRFWQGWVFLGLQASFFIFFLLDFLERDPQLLERRLHNKESQPEQKRFQKLFVLVVLLAFVLAGLDFRFQWSQKGLGGVPVALALAAQAIVVAGYRIVYWVMKTNTFAAATIRVEAEQSVIQTGPYAWVRHPMYSGMIMTALAIPLALGSYVASPIFAMFAPALVYRLIHEERTLRLNLPGYTAYCERTRYRLVPGVW
jgi:protein-S-isoprenylcysteine O-methyltransferase Ste14